MNKLNLLLTSLIVAIPGAILAVLLVMAFLYHGGGANVAFQGLAGLTLLVGASMAALPGAVLVFVKGDLKAPATAKRKKQAEPEEEEAPAEPEGGDDFELGATSDLADAEDESLAETTPPEDDLGNDMAVSDFLDRSSVEEEDMMIIDADSSSEADEFPMEDEDDLFGDDEDTPKKKKKKK